MRVILPKLEKRSATDVVTALTTNLQALSLHSGDEAQAKLYATLQLAEQSLPGQVRPLLTPLALHEGFVDADYLENMTRRVAAEWTRVQIDSFLQGLAAAGLLRDCGQAIYEMHPMLTSFLRATWLPSISAEERESWARAFVEIMGHLANILAPRELHEQRGGFHWHSANFYYAMGEAQRLGMDLHFRALLQALGCYAQNLRNYQGASELFSQLAQARKSAGNEKEEAAAYHQVGMIAEEQRDFQAAEAWYRKSLVINEKQGNQHGAAPTYHQLGRIAEAQRDFQAAEAWYRKSLAINEKQGNQHGAASTYGQLGILAGLQEHYERAGQLLVKAILAFLTCNDRHSAQRNVSNFLLFHQRAGIDVRSKLKVIWEEAGLGPFPDSQ